jgi:hypothetical protein
VITDEDLQEIEQQFRDTRAAQSRFGCAPNWSDFYAGERLLDEVKQLRRARREGPRTMTEDDLREIELFATELKVPEKVYVSNDPYTLEKSLLIAVKRDMTALVAEVRRLQILLTTAKEEVALLQAKANP